MNKIPVGKGNVQEMWHEGTTLYVIFASSQRTYAYEPVTTKTYQELVEANQDEDREVFKSKFKTVKEASNYSEVTPENE